MDDKYANGEDGVDPKALDIQLAGSLTAAGLLSDEGLQAMQQVLQGSQDPAAAIGNAIFMAISKVREKLDQNDMAIDDTLWAAKGGVLDRVLFEVITALKAVLGFEAAGTSEFAQAVKQSVIQLMEQESAGGGEMPPQEGQMPPQQAPMQPQGQPQMQGSPLLGGM